MPKPCGTYANCMLGQLHHCLQNRVTFEASIAFPPPTTAG